MRILIIGNSHAATLAQGLKKKPFALVKELDFLVGPGTSLSNDLTINDNVIKIHKEQLASRLKIPNNSSTTGLINLNDYDRIITIGNQLISKEKGDNWIKLAKASERKLSKQCWNLLAKDTVECTNHYQMLAKIKNKSTLNKILSIPSPFPNITHPLFKKLKIHYNQRISEHLEWVKEHITNLGVSFIHLPDELLDDNKCAVASKFKSLRDGDYSHLNEAGSMILIEHINSWLETNTIATQAQQA